LILLPTVRGGGWPLRFQRTYILTSAIAVWIASAKSRRSGDGWPHNLAVF
jgi:hypothetical protein